MCGDQIALLVIDVGNTNIALGVYRGRKMAAHWRLATEPQRTADEYGILLSALFQDKGLSPADIGGMAIACVVPPLLPTFQTLARERFGVEPLVVGPGIRTGVRIRIDNPRELGADRLVNAVAVKELYGAPAIVIDFGTATTFDVVSAEGDYLGGAIAPGLGISAEALFRRTAKLPRIELVPPPGPVGHNTIHSMQSGVLYGYVGLVEGLVARIERELGAKARVVATGGLANLIAGQTKVIEAVDENLTLKGLRLIYEMNQ